MIPAQLNVVTLGARDLPRLRDFYTALGWEPAIEAEDFCAFRLGGVFLGLFPWDKLAADGQARAAPRADGMRGFSLGINVEAPFRPAIPLRLGAGSAAPARRRDSSRSR